MKKLNLALLILALTAGCAATTVGRGQEAADVAEVAAQVDRGREVYDQRCAVCHGAELTGGAGTPGLKGVGFKFGWNGATAAELAELITITMPPGQENSLTEQQVADMIALILVYNASEPDAALAGDFEALGDVIIEIE